MPFGGESAESYYDEGLTAAMKGDLKRATECFEKAISLDRNYTAAYHQLGKCHLRRGDTRRALEILQQVVLENPAQASGQVDPRTGRRIQGERPLYTGARIDLGYAFLSAGEAEQAVKHFQEVIAIDPMNGRAHLGLASAAFAAGEWRKAISEAQMALANGAPSFPAHFLLGRAAKLVRESALVEDALGQADALAEKQVELTPEQPEGHFFRGEIAFVQDQLPRALEHYRAAEDRAQQGRNYSAFGEPFSYLDVLVKQGLCLQRLGQRERAREMGERVGKLDPEHRLGRALREA